MCMLLMGCGSGGGFSPLSLNPTLLALPENSFSDNGITPAVDNDPVYFVNDASTNNNDLTQVSLANRPLYDADAFGTGKPGWVFDGLNDIIQRSWTALQSASQATVFIVCSLGSKTQQQTLFGGGASFWGLNHSWRIGSTTDTVGVYTSAGNFASYVDSDKSTHIRSTIYDGSLSGSNKLKLFRNGVTKSFSVTGTLDSTLDAANVLVIGGRATFSDTFAGNLGHIYVFPTALTESQHNSCGQHLASIYGLSWG